MKKREVYKKWKNGEKPEKNIKIFLQTFFGHFFEITNDIKNEKCKKIGKLFYPRGIFRQLTDALNYFQKKNHKKWAIFSIFCPKKIGKLFYPRGIFRQLTDALNYFLSKKLEKLTDFFIFCKKKIGKLFYPLGIFRQLTDAPNYIKKLI